MDEIFDGQENVPVNGRGFRLSKKDILGYTAIAILALAALLMLSGTASAFTIPVGTCGVFLNSTLENETICAGTADIFLIIQLSNDTQTFSFTNATSNVSVSAGGNFTTILNTTVINQTNITVVNNTTTIIQNITGCNDTNRTIWANGSITVCGNITVTALSNATQNGTAPFYGEFYPSSSSQAIDNATAHVLIHEIPAGYCMQNVTASYSQNATFRNDACNITASFTCDAPAASCPEDTGPRSIVPYGKTTIFLSTAQLSPDQAALALNQDGDGLLQLKDTQCSSQLQGMQDQVTAANGLYSSAQAKIDELKHDLANNQSVQGMIDEAVTKVRKEESDRNFMYLVSGVGILILSGLGYAIIWLGTKFTQRNANSRISGMHRAITPELIQKGKDLGSRNGKNPFREG